MRDLTGKLANGGATGDGQLSPAEWNDLANELKNLIELNGKTSTNANLNQIGITLQEYVMSGTHFADTGAADAYVLGVTDGRQSPSGYVDGMQVRFIPTNTNTGGTCTVNVSGLGVTNVFLNGGVTDPSINTILSGKEATLTYRTAPVVHFEVPDIVIDNDTFATQLLHIQDQKPNGTHGGTFTKDAWQTRDLNTILTNEILGSSLSSNQITLPIGTYYVEAATPAHKVLYHKAKLANISDASDTIIGQNAKCATDTASMTNAIVSGRFTIASSKVFEVQHRCDTNRDTDGYGDPGSFGLVEVYTDVKIWKVA